MAVDKGPTLAQLRSDLKARRFMPLYLFHGEEDFLTSQAVELVRSTVLKGIPVDFNFDQYYGSDCDMVRLVESANTLPMMASHRLVILREIHALKDKGLDVLAGYCEKPSPSTVLVLAGDSLSARGPAKGGEGEGKGEKDEAGAEAGDKGKGGKGKGAKRGENPRARLLAALKKQAMVIEMKPLRQYELSSWIQGEVKELGKSIDANSVGFLTDMVGDNLRELHSELTKVALFTGTRDRITLADLQAVISDVSLETIWEFNEAVTNRQTERALLTLGRLLEADPKGGVQQVVAMLSRHFRQLALIEQGLREGLDDAAVCVKAGMGPQMAWKMKDFRPMVKARGRKGLLDALKLLYETSVSLRSSRVPPEVQLEGLILRLCQP